VGILLIAVTGKVAFFIDFRRRLLGTGIEKDKTTFYTPNDMVILNFIKPFMVDRTAEIAFSLDIIHNYLTFVKSLLILKQRPASTSQACILNLAESTALQVI